MASRRKNPSVYENTTTIAVNLVRASSLALAQIAVGRGRGAAPVPPAAAPAPAPPARPVSGMRLMVEPAGNRPAKYLMEPDTGDAAAAGGTVDESAARFIERIRKNLRDQHDSVPAANFTPPPPVPKSAPRKNLRDQHDSVPAANFTPPPPVPKSAPRFAA